MSSARASPILPMDTWIKLGIGPSQIEKRVHFDRRLGRTKIRPRKQRKAQINRRAVERVHSVGEIRSRSPASHKVCARGGSKRRRGRTTCASRAIRSRWPTSISRPLPAIPYHTISRVARAGRLQCRAGFRDTSFARTPWCGIVPCKRRLRTRTSPPYFATMRSKLVQGTKSMTCGKQRPAQRSRRCPRSENNRGNYRKTVIPSSNRHQTKSTLTLCYKSLSTPPSALNRTAMNCSRILAELSRQKSFLIKGYLLKK